MARVTLDLDGDTTARAPRVRCCPVPEEGTSFLLLVLSPTVAVVLPGVNAAAADYARQLAAALVDAADALDASQILNRDDQVGEETT